MLLCLSSIYNRAKKEVGVLGYESKHTSKRKDGELVKLTLKRLTFEDIDQIMALQDEIVEV